MTTPNCRRPARIAVVFTSMAAASVVAAAPALAAATLDITGAGSNIIQIDYSCDGSAGVASIQAMMGDPNADRPAAQGIQNSVECNGSPQSATVPLTTDPSQPPLTSGSEAQVRVALVDRNGTVVSGQAKKFTVP
ncbi:hypothetical protein [Nocardia lijiangensis]|uniref:hypothetical protein n=1 Tax=Nocardia lijiangensis TaxID=299618 RepID=UPI000AF6F6DD|nr:hypothetical protein [Nocardia lijiangensis]